MKKLALAIGLIISVLSLTSQADIPPNPFDKSNFVKDQFSVVFINKNEINYSFSGTGSNSLAVELLGYLQAGVASGVTVQTQDAMLNATGYKAGRFGALDARTSDKNVSPPLNISVTRSTLDTWPNWTVNYQGGKITVNPVNEDSATLVQLMEAAGVKPTTVKSFDTELRYAGNKVICLKTIPGADSSMAVQNICWLTLDNN